jgi:hypothetical protein
MTYKENIVLIKAYYGNPYVDDVMKKLSELKLQKRILYINEYGDNKYPKNGNMGTQIYGEDDNMDYISSVIKDELLSNAYEIVVVDGDFQNFAPDIASKYDNIIFIFIVEELEKYNDEKEFLIIDLDDIKGASLLKRSSKANIYKKRLEDASFIKDLNLF